MSKEERTGWRDELFSKWHRQIEPDNRLKCVDGDWNEVCGRCWETLAIFELCANYSNTSKVATATQMRAAHLDVPAYIVLYYGSEYDGRVKLFFRLRRLHPDPAPFGQFKEASEEQMKQLIWNIHRYCKNCGRTEELPDGVRLIPSIALCKHNLHHPQCYVCSAKGVAS